MGFVNFVDSRCAADALRVFGGFEWRFGAHSSALEVAWSDPHQGVDIHVERYRNCPVMHDSVDDEYKPMLLRSGVRVPYPGPTKPLLSAPRDLRRRADARLR